VNSKIRLDAGIVSFGESVTIAAQYIYFVQDTGTASTSRIIGYADLNYGGAANVSVTTDAFKFDFSDSGIYELTP
jgi:hypothetical protein